MITRFALAATLGLAALSAVPQSSQADDIIVIGDRIEEVDWFFYDRAWGGGGGYGGFSFTADGGGGGGGFSLELPPDCTVDVCMDDPEVDPDESTVIVVEAKLVDSINSMTDVQFNSLIPYLYNFAYEVDYQIKLGMLGYEPDLTYAESLITTVFELTVQYGVENGAITLSSDTGGGSGEGYTPRGYEQYQ